MKFRLIIPKYPTFNIYSHIVMPPQGAVGVATAIRDAGFEVEVIDENNYKGRINHLRLQKEDPCDFVGFYGGMTSSIPRLYKIARQYKNMGVTTLAGGSHVYYSISEALDNSIDYIIIGEGEIVTPKLLQTLKSGKKLIGIKGLAYRNGSKIINTGQAPIIQNLDELAFPDFSLIRNPAKKINAYPISMTRGCQYRCEFCVVKDKPRSRSYLSVVNELMIQHQLGIKHFFFVDDNFIANKPETMKLLKAIVHYRKKTKANMEFTIQLRVDAASDRELLRLMKLAGISTIAIGYETIYDEVLKTMKKGITRKKIEYYTKVLHNYGFFIHGMFIFGYPDLDRKGTLKDKSLREQANDYLRFVRRNKIDTIQVLKPVPLVGTVFRERLEKEGRIYPEIGFDKYDGNFVVFEPDGDPEELQKEAMRVMRKFYNWRNYLKLASLPALSTIDLAFYFLSGFWHGKKINFEFFKKRWRNPVIRAWGYNTVKNWRLDFKKEDFIKLLNKAHLKKNNRLFKKFFMTK